MCGREILTNGSEKIITKGSTEDVVKLAEDILKFNNTAIKDVDAVAGEVIEVPKIVNGDETANTAIKDAEVAEEGVGEVPKVVNGAETTNTVIKDAEVVAGESGEVSKVVNGAETTNTVIKDAEVVAGEAGEVSKIVNSAETANTVREDAEVVAEDVGKGSKGVSNPSLTEPSLPKGGELTEDEIAMLTSKKMSKGHQAEIDTAKLFKAEGYDIKPLEEVEGGKGNGYGLKETSNPDYLVEGEPFDCYAPEGGNVKTVVKEINGKTKDQAEKIILNLDNYQGDIGELKDMILRKTNGDLKRLNELLVVKDGKITRWFMRGE